MKIAIDPGWSGSIALVDDQFNVSVDKMPETIFDIINYFKELDCNENVVCIMEKVGAMPRDGRKALWRFSENVTTLKCALYMARISTAEVTPRVWQGKLGVVMPKEKKDRKNKIKALMQQKYPHIKVVLWNADSLAILATSTV